MRRRDLCPVCKQGYPYMHGTERTGLKIMCYKCGATLGLDNEVFHSYDRALKIWNLLARRYNKTNEQ